MTPLSFIRFRSRVILAALFFAVVLSNCKTAAKRRTAGSSLAGDEQDVISLRDFQYETDNLLLKALSSRIDCKAAAELVILPASGSLKKTVTGTYQSPYPYEFLLEQLFNPGSRIAQCAPQSKKSAESELTGMRKLLSAARQKNLGLTFIMAGGFGSHLTESGALYDSRDLWSKAFAEDIKRGDLRILRHECQPNSFATDDECAPKIHTKFMELEATKTKEHRYLFWGYSKGGTSMLQALASFPDIRERTLALITVGSPFGGGLPMVMIHPLVESLAKNRSEMTEFNRGLLGTMLSFGAGASLGNSASVAQKILPMYTGPEFETVRAGIRSLLPSQRKNFLFEKVKSWDLSRSEPDPMTGTRDFPIFHVAAALDVAKLEAFPLLSTDSDGNIVIQSGTQDLTHMGQLTSIINFRRHPISDSCVALEHSVLPVDVVPKGAKASLLGVLALDHMALGFSRRLDALESAPAANLPRTAIVDAILDSASTRMGIQ